MTSLRAQMLGIAFGFGAAAVLAATPAWSGASILIDADSGKVLRAENATYPWYPASTTKLMTLYMTLSAIRDNRITFDTLFTVSRNANMQAPTKMGFPVGTQVTVDNALKMMMVKSANDMAVLLAEGVGGSIDDFAEQMTDTAHKLGMTESNFVNPNGLPADGQISSARDLAILARALIREFPEYSSYWHIPAIKFGRRIVRNYNPLLGRYPGADGMKTGFICASGFNLVATATRNNKHLIAVVLGAPSGAVRAMKAAEMFESGFSQNPLSWLTPSLGAVDALAPMEVAPPNLQDQTCGKHRRRPAAEDEDMDADSDNTQANASASETRSLLLSALRAPTNPVLLSDLGPVMPVVVYTGPTRSPSQLATLTSDVAAAPDKKKTKHKATAARSTDDEAAPELPAKKKSVVAKPTVAKPAEVKPAAKPSDTKTTAKPADTKTTAKPTEPKPAAKKPAASAGPWTPTSPSALAASPPPELKTSAQAGAPAAAKKQIKPKPVAAAPAQ